MEVPAKKRQGLVDSMVGRLSSKDYTMLANQLGNENMNMCNLPFRCPIQLVNRLLGSSEFNRSR